MLLAVENGRHMTDFGPTKRHGTRGPGLPPGATPTSSNETGRQVIPGPQARIPFLVPAVPVFRGRQSNGALHCLTDMHQRGIMWGEGPAFGILS
jgi:hypothetical protein